ncbi:hypothetical protein F2P56_022488, partial [Juglans regia]
MNSTLLVLITVFIINRGEAYMMMENMLAANPQNTALVLPASKAKRETKATVEKTKTTNKKIPKSLAFSLLGAYMRKMVTYMSSIADPVPLIVDTKRLFGDTKGRPYHAERRQLSNVIMYGTPENFSVPLCRMILLNVIIGAKKRNKAVKFPNIPNTECTVIF